MLSFAPKESTQWASSRVLLYVLGLYVYSSGCTGPPGFPAPYRPAWIPPCTAHHGTAGHFLPSDFERREHGSLSSLRNKETANKIPESRKKNILYIKYRWSYLQKKTYSQWAWASSDKRAKDFVEISAKMKKFKLFTLLVVLVKGKYFKHRYLKSSFSKTKIDLKFPPGFWNPKSDSKIAPCPHVSHIDKYWNRSI